MPRAIKFTSKTKMLVANQADLPLADVEAMLEVAESARKDHGDCYFVLDYPSPEGTTISWASMHQEYFEKHFEFETNEYDRKFVPVKILTPTTH